MRGGGEMASAAARLLFLGGCRVVVLEREEPLAVRRLVAFAEAVRAGETLVEGVRGVRVRREDLTDACRPGAEAVHVVVDEEGASLRLLRPDVVVDGRMAKRNLGSTLRDALVVIGLGPGFAAGADVHAVVETERGPDLGRVFWTGGAQADTRVPAPVSGVTDERVLRAPAAGAFRASAAIGDLVSRGDRVGDAGGAAVIARTAGLVRGLIADGVRVPAGTKIGDVDPRGRAVDPAVVSDKARAVAAGVLEAVSLGLARAGLIAKETA